MKSSPTQWRNRSFPIRLAGGFILGVTLGSALAAAPEVYNRNWPQWRGPTGNGVALQGNPPVEWIEQENEKCKVRIPGKSHATPVVWEDIFLRGHQHLYRVTENGSASSSAAAEAKKTSEEKPDDAKKTVSAPSAPKPAPGLRASLSEVFRKPAPAHLEDLKAIERHVTELAARISPSVVGIGVGDARGSGVVISKDGLVLCAAHVSDRPGREARFTFSDGKTASGKSLGTDHEMDASLMKITDPGDWPHADLGDPDGARIGDWVLALGHPGGFDPQRSIVVRLGRIIRLAADAIQTDCTLTAGDSGGPLFDMHGRVVGIHSRISDSTADNYHVPIGTYFATWDRLARSETWGGEERPTRPPYVGADGADDPDGCRLERVDETSPAFKAGLKVGDIVVQLDDQPIQDRDSFLRRVRQAKPGDEIRFGIRRESQALSLTVKVEPSRGRRR